MTAITKKNTSGQETADKIGKTISYVILIGWALIALAPLFFTLVFSFKPVENAYDPPIFFPIPFTLENYKTVLSTFDLFPRWVFNSTLISVVTTGFQVVFCAMGGYAFARLRFPLKNALFLILLITMMLPAQVSLIPNFLIIGPGILKDFQILGVPIPTGFNLIDNPIAIILPKIAAAFGIFMMTQFYKSIPKELEEAAFMDGLGRVGIFFRIILPISKTQLLTLGLLTFQGVWNEFLWPLIVLRSPEMFTLPIGLQWFRGEYYTLYSVVLAGSLFNTIPIIILFFVFQRYFVKGIATTGLKGA